MSGSRILIALSAGGLILAVAGLAWGVLMWRWETIPVSWGYIERDRWTGRASACMVEIPFSFINEAISRAEKGKTLGFTTDSAAPGYYGWVPGGPTDPPRLCLELN
jgi:hypothetical protein